MGVLQASGDPIRRLPWYRFIRAWALIFWLVVSVAGIVLAVVPAAYSFKVLLSSSVVGAGVTGLLSEFTIWFDRRQDDFDLQVQNQQYADLETQVGHVDGLMRKTAIMAVNRMFKLGFDLYQVRFLDAGQGELFRAEAMDLAEVLKLTPAVQKFLGNPFLLAKHGLPGPGQDPFPELKGAVELRYAQDVREALMAGSMVCVIMHTAGGLADEKYRAQATELLRKITKLLYLLPQVSSNLLRAMEEIPQGTFPPNYIAGYLTLFSFYMTYRMNGLFPEVAPLFEAPASLADPATVAEIKRILGRLSGQQVDAPEPAGGPPAAAAAKGPGRAHRPRLRWADVTALMASVRRWVVVFWLAVAAAGLVMAVIPVNYGVKVLLSSAIVGAGVAGVLSEFTYLSDRRQAKRELHDQEQRYLRTKDHVGRVEGMLRTADIVTINQMFKLGYALTWPRFGRPDQAEGFIRQARELADFLGLTAVLDRYLNDPYLRAADNPPPPGKDPMLGLKEAVTLRYAQEGVAAFNAGFTLGTVLNLGLPGGKFPAQAIDILRQSIEFLDLSDEAHANLRRAMDELQQGAYEPRAFLLYLIQFGAYLRYRATGDDEEVAALFESRVSLTQPSTVAEAERLLQRQAGAKADEPANPPPAPATPAPAPGGGPRVG
jgi:hypothetical protein